MEDGEKYESDELGDGDRFFVEEHEGRLGRWRLQTPPSRRALRYADLSCVQAPDLEVCKRVVREAGRRVGVTSVS